MNCRMRVCHLGEELLPSILYVWMDMRPSVALKEEIVEFLNLEMCAHHPKGAKTQDTGRVSFPYVFKKQQQQKKSVSGGVALARHGGLIVGCVLFHVQSH